MTWKTLHSKRVLEAKRKSSEVPTSVDNNNVSNNHNNNNLATCMVTMTENQYVVINLMKTIV